MLWEILKTTILSKSGGVEGGDSTEGRWILEREKINLKSDTQNQERKEY